MITIYEGRQGEGMSMNIDSYIHDMENCSIMELQKYRCLCFNFPEMKGDKFGMIVNEKGLKFYLIKNEFKEKLEREGFL